MGGRTSVRYNHSLGVRTSVSYNHSLGGRTSVRKLIYKLFLIRTKVRTPKIDYCQQFVILKL